MRLRALSMNEKIEKEDQSLMLIAQKIIFNISIPQVTLTQSFLRKSKMVTQESKKLHCYIAPGNNSVLVKKVMSARPQWNIAETEGQMINFKWKFQFPTTQQYSESFFQIQNHISNHQQLTEKANLINNLLQYCQNNKIYVWDITPVSFVFDLTCPNEYVKEMKDFQKFYQKYHPLRVDKQNKKKGRVQLIKENKFVKRKMHSSLLSEDNNYLWIFKPTQFNRGRGIQLFSTLDELNVIIKSMEFGTTDYQFANQNNRTIKSKQFIIQKYIQRPFLIDGRKFDIRTWVLVTQDLDIYLFDQGYLRMASEYFALDNMDTFIHLTNNAVQKYSQNYNQFEQGNQLSYQEFDHLTNELFTVKVIPVIKQIIVLSMYSVKRKLTKRKYNFELLGYDFMIDENLKPWLIEINANPCLEESSQLLKNLIPKMLDDAFQLVIDIYTHKKPKQNNQWEHLIQL